jgi:hypothetical protein
MSTPRKVILLPWPGSDLGPALYRRANESASLALSLGADLEILLTPAPDAAQFARARGKLLSKLPRHFRVALETDPSDPVVATLSAVKRRGIWFAVLNAEPGKLRLTEWQREVVERIGVPIMLVPSKAKLGPLKSILVPMEGSPPGADSGLDFGIKLATLLKLPLDILHITSAEGDDESLVGEFSDSFHHDYPHQMDGMIAAASPLSSARDRRVIRKFLHVRGQTKQELVRSLSRYKHGLIAVQWKGSFAPGRAELVRSVLRASPCPILLVKPPREKKSMLFLGDTLLAA